MATLAIQAPARHPETKRPRLAALALCAIAFLSYLMFSGAARAAPAVDDPKANADFIWHLFVAAVRPTGNAQAPLAFETWKEQCDLGLNCGPSRAQAVAPRSARPEQGKVRRAHGSALARQLRKSSALTANASSQEGCSGMNTEGFPSVPATNVAAGAVFCEEVFVNPAEAAFIVNNKLGTIKGQQAHGNVTFPIDSVEIKVDWAPQSSFTKPFSCPDATIYTEMIQFEGQKTPTCYALVGMHITSKALPDWVWATFEPNNALTNPNRCNGDLYDLCFDPWGTTSAQPYGPGQTPAQSPELAALMREAELPPTFANYFLTGVQTQHVNAGQPTQLGNSFVEYNAGVPPHQASCITCHNYAYAGTTTIGTALPGWPMLGYACNKTNAGASCLPPAGKTSWTSEDFSWLLGIMPTGKSAKKPK